MGLFDKLFGKKSAPSVGGGRISMHAINLQQGQSLSSQRCGIDGHTFACPAGPQSVITANPDKFALDVGGYCDTCQAFRCQDHARWVEVAPMDYRAACTKCGNQMRGAVG